MTTAAMIGPWDQFIDYRVWEELYPALAEHPIFASIFMGYPPTAIDFEPLPDDVFEQLFEEAKQYAADSVAGRDLPVHTVEDHCEEVCEYGLLLFDMVYDRRNPFYKFVRQMYAIALILHDCHHTGSTFLIDAINPAWIPDGNVHVAMEWVSATRVIAFLHPKVASRLAILFVASVILYTTFGGGYAAEAKGVRNIPVIGPEHYTLPIFCMTRTADVQPPGDIVDSIDKGLKLAFWERPGFAVERSFAAFVNDQLRFFKYVLDCYDALLRSTGHDLARVLGWRERRDLFVREFTLLQEGKHLAGEQFLRAKLAEYGIHN